jgi:hypothetical protein
MDQKAGVSATLAIILAVGSYILSFSGRPGWGLVAALFSIPLGAVGLIRSVSPRVGGGVLSIAAIVLGVVAIGMAVLVMIGVLLF